MNICVYVWVEDLCVEFSDVVVDGLEVRLFEASHVVGLNVEYLLRVGEDLIVLVVLIEQ